MGSHKEGDAAKC